MPDTASTIHATAVLVGSKAVLIRGPSGSGKSRLALALLQALSFARLVGDDRVHLQPTNGRLIVRPAKELMGLLEVRGVGIRRLPFEQAALVGLVVDLAAQSSRLPEPTCMQTELAGISLPRLGLSLKDDPLPVVLAVLERPARSD